MISEYDLVQFIRAFKACAINPENIYKSARIEFKAWHDDEVIIEAMMAEGLLVTVKVSQMPKVDPPDSGLSRAA